MPTGDKNLFCDETRPPACGIVIFGASGDLTSRKLLPALFALFERQLLPAKFFILGCARTEMSDDSFRARASGALRGLTANSEFLRACRYLSGDYSDPAFYGRLAARLGELEGSFGTGGNRLFYLSTPPVLYEPIAANLGAAGLVAEGDGGGWRRVVFEKPFGRDLASATALDKALRRVLAERQIFRIDHYVGKETVQNILIFRFANTVFEPVWNLNYIDNVQITVAESIGVGHRAGYYESAGLLRDMFQNHMLEMLSLVAMEPPGSFDADRIRDEKTQLIRSIRPFPPDDLSCCFVRGQYEAGEVEGTSARGYREEEGVRPDSDTETFVAARLFIDNWRWRGVPFYLRSGKRLKRKVSEIAITFKRVPHSIFTPLSPEDLNPNVLVLNVQPEEGFSLTIQAKRPGARLCMSQLPMDFYYHEAFGGEMPDAYERLLLDCMTGGQALFIRGDMVEASWALFTPVLERWKEGCPKPCDIHPYKAGSAGPAAADLLVGRDSRKWRKL